MKTQDENQDDLKGHPVPLPHRPETGTGGDALVSGFGNRVTAK
jgi:hypothetical protein